MIVGYLICIGLVVKMNMSPLPRYEQNPAFNKPFFADSNSRHRRAVENEAEEMAKSRERKTYAYLIGYPLTLLLGFWVYSGFKQQNK
jgi:hypothetical protein